MFGRLLIAAIIAVVPVFAFGQGTERSVVIEATATVTSIDAETREIVLENSETGQSEMIVAGPEVVNFDQIEVGDTVKAVYKLGIAARMAAADEVDGIMAIDGRAAEGSTPGVISGTAVTLILEFMSFDADASVAVVKDSMGLEQSIEVATDAGREFASGLTAGDMIALTFTEGLAVGIVKE